MYVRMFFMVSKCTMSVSFQAQVINPMMTIAICACNFLRVRGRVRESVRNWMMSCWAWIVLSNQWFLPSTRLSFSCCNHSFISRLLFTAAHLWEQWMIEGYKMNERKNEWRNIRQEFLFCLSSLSSTLNSQHSVRLPLSNSYFQYTKSYSSHAHMNTRLIAILLSSSFSPHLSHTRIPPSSPWYNS